MICTSASVHARSLATGVLLAVLGAASLTGCGAGSTAETSQPYNPGDGRNVNIPEDASFDDDYLAVRNALVVSDGGAASVTLTVVNHGSEPDVLNQIKVNDQVAVFAGGPFEVVPQQKIAVGGGSEAVALVSDAGVEPGQWTELSLTFNNAGETIIDVLVVSSTDEYTVLGEDV